MLSDITERKQVEAELERRAAQQAAVALLGEHALEGANTAELMQEAVTSAAELLGVEISAVWELLPAESALVLRAGIGWPESAFGTLRYPAGEGSQAGYTLLTGAPVVVEDWDAETPLRAAGLRRPADRRRAVGQDRGPLARAVRRARGPVDGQLGASPPATSTSSRRWPTCWPMRSSARRSRTPSATGPCTTR